MANFYELDYAPNNQLVDLRAIGNVNPFSANQAKK